MLGLKLNHVSKRGPWEQAITWTTADQALWWHGVTKDPWGNILDQVMAYYQCGTIPDSHVSWPNFGPIWIAFWDAIT